jgi:hypothetical protein
VNNCSGSTLTALPYYKNTYHPEQFSAPKGLPPFAVLRFNCVPTSFYHHQKMRTTLKPPLECRRRLFRGTSAAINPEITSPRQIRICRSDKLKVVLLITFQKNREDTLLHFLLSNLFPNVPWEMLLLKKFFDKKCLSYTTPSINNHKFRPF